MIVKSGSKESKGSKMSKRSRDSKDFKFGGLRVNDIGGKIDTVDAFAAQMGGQQDLSANNFQGLSSSEVRKLQELLRGQRAIQQEIDRIKNQKTPT